MKILKQQKAAETVGKTAGKAAIDESDNQQNLYKGECQCLIFQKELLNI